jgi:hypothetical protein
MRHTLFGTPSAEAPSNRLFSQHGTWIGHIWDFSARRLLSCFGDVYPRSWSSSFAAGAGVVGHCFRFSVFAAWHREDTPNEKSVIHQERPESHEGKSPRYRWICCFPLRLDKEGPAIGVVGFASSQDTPTTPFERQMDHFVTRYLSSGSDAEIVALRTKLEISINAAFWTVLTDATDLVEGNRDYAKHILDQIERV